MRLKLGQNGAPARFSLMLLMLGSCIAVQVLLADVAVADIKGTLDSLQSKLTGVILPTLAVISIAWAAFSLMTGNERAKTHIWYSIIGSALAFGSQILVDFIRQTVR